MNRLRQLIIVFWGIMLPLAAIAGLTLLGIHFYEDHQNKKRERERVQLQASLTAKLAAATVASRDPERRWLVQWTRDPASGQNVARSAEVQSDGDVCTLQVEQRINGSRLTGIYCPGFKIDTFAGIEVKFDNRGKSDEMNVEQFSDSPDVFIKSYQPFHSRGLQYDEFLKRLTTGKTVALQMKFDVADWHWVSFSLRDAEPALIAIGAVQPAANKK